MKTFAIFVGGALGGGLIGFLLGFVGPVLLAPDANQGPLLGIFITGPLGLMFGGPVALMLRNRRRRKHGG